jgi:hypothetical protein
VRTGSTATGVDHQRAGGELQLERCVVFILGKNVSPTSEQTCLEP